jgi:hypothetical protein
MKRFLQTSLMLTFILLTVQPIFAQETFPGNGYVDVYPATPAPTDSVYLVYTYVSSDGCPDYYLALDSLAPGFAKVSLKEIPFMGRPCTMVVMKFKITINLGVFSQSTEIYFNDKWIKTIVPPKEECIPDRIGKVISSTEKSTLIQEDNSPYIFEIQDQSIKTGTIVKFNGTLIQCFAAPCYNIVNCYKIIADLPTCDLNRKGIIVIGKNDCANQLFIQEYSPISSAIQLWKIATVTADAYYKPGDQVIFGGNKIIPDSEQSFFCRIVGYAYCVKKTESPVTETVELKVKVLADSMIVQSGYAVLFKKGIRKAVASVLINDDALSFKGEKNSSYTVFVVPNRKLYPGYLPTYYINKLSWKNADFINLNDSVQEIQVMLRKHRKYDGNGKITGNIHYENADLKDSTLVKNGIYTEKTGVYDGSACNIPVILFNGANEAIAWTVTDENGYYIFENIPSGNYTVLAETASASAESAVNMDGELNQKNADLMLKSSEENTDVEQLSEDILQIYPNPVKDQCIIQVSHAGQMNLFTISGQLVKNQQLNSGSNLIVLDNLKQGIYILRFGGGNYKLKMQ